MHNNIEILQIYCISYEILNICTYTLHLLTYMNIIYIKNAIHSV